MHRNSSSTRSILFSKLLLAWKDLLSASSRNALHVNLCERRTGCQSERLYSCSLVLSYLEHCQGGKLESAYVFCIRFSSVDPTLRPIRTTVASPALKNRQFLHLFSWCARLLVLGVVWQFLLLVDQYDALWLCLSVSLTSRLGSLLSFREYPLCSMRYIL